MWSPMVTDTVSNMYELLGELCNLDNLGRGDLIIKRITELGLVPTIQEFEENGETYRNIIVRVREGSPTSEIGVSAHYDRDEEGQGALDNGASVVEVLGLLEVVVQDPRDLDFTFLFFDAEEKGGLGSKYFTAETPRGFDGLYNIEVAGVGDSVVVGKTGFDPYTKEKVVNAANLNLRVEEVCKTLGLPFFKVDTPPSDDVAFNLSGVPATQIFAFPEEEVRMWLDGVDPWDLPTAQNLHGPNDAYDKVDPNTLTMMKNVLVALAESYR